VAACRNVCPKDARPTRGSRVLQRTTAKNDFSVERNFMETPRFNRRPSRGGDYEWPYISYRLNCRDHVYSFVPRASLTEESGMVDQIVPSDLEES
jgi:hypothetical protein